MTAIAGGIMAVAFCVWKGSLGSSLNRTGDLRRFRSTPRPQMESEAARAQSIPYALAIAIGTMLSLFPSKGGMMSGVEPREGEEANA